MKLGRKLFAGGISIVVVAGLLTSDAQADTSAIAAEWASAWADVPTANGVSLASGVSTINGSPSAGATVILWADTDVAAMLVPDSIAISRTTSASDGTWSVSLPAGVNLTRYTNETTKMINFEVQTFDGTGTSRYSFSALAGPVGGQQAEPSTGTATLDGNAVALMTDPATTSGITLDSTQAPVQKQQPSATVIPDTRVCTNYDQGYDDDVKTQIGYTADDAGGPGDTTTMEFSNVTGSSSSLGVATSGSGAVGSFSRGGTRSTENTVGSIAPHTHNVAYRNYYGYTRYDHIHQQCITKDLVQNYYFVESIGFDGGSSDSAAPAIGMGHCTPVSPNYTMTLTTTSAYVMTSGVDISGIIGIDLSSQSGYSSELSISAVTTTYGHPWCGFYNPPGIGSSRPGLVDFHNTRYYS